MVNLKNESTTISATSAKLELISKVPDNDKTFTKKLLLSMTVAALKNMCAKLFKVDMLSI